MFEKLKNYLRYVFYWFYTIIGSPKPDIKELIKCIYSNNLKLFELKLKLNPDLVNQQGNDGERLLATAAKQNHSFAMILVDNLPPNFIINKDDLRIALEIEGPVFERLWNKLNKATQDDLKESLIKEGMVMPKLNHESIKCLIQAFPQDASDQCFTKIDNNTSYNLLYIAQSKQGIEIFKLLFNKLSPTGQAKAACIDKLTDGRCTLMELAITHNPLARILKKAALTNRELQKTMIEQYPTSIVTNGLRPQPPALTM